MNWIKSSIPNFLYRRMDTDPFKVFDSMKALNKYTSFSKRQAETQKSHGQYLFVLEKNVLENKCDELIEIVYDYNWLVKNNLLEWVSKLSNEKYVERAVFELKRHGVKNPNKKQIEDFINVEIEELYGDEFEVVAVNMQELKSKDIYERSVDY